MSRTGFGYDAHRIGGDGPLVLGGVQIAPNGGLIGTSDADVATHAVIDALLGAAALGDIGDHFPSSNARWEGANSMSMLGEVAGMLSDDGASVASVDVTIVAEDVLIAPHRAAMRRAIAAALSVPVDRVSVKATTTDGIGAIGRGEGIAAHAVATLD
jgi:2-C-methyl-D-erythritol 2,4-cyclodiphosphate synthase